MIVAGFRKFPILFLGVLTVINAGIFLRRDNFEFDPTVSEHVLYAPPSTGWDRFLTDFPAQGRIHATRFIDSVLQGTDTSRLSQVKRIGSFLYTQFAAQLGKPSLNDPYKDPWEMYLFYSSDRTRKLWCGHLAMMFNYFCLARGIESRMIEIMKPGDHHVVNECYLPGTRQWVLVDLTYDQLLVARENRELLGLAAFRNMQGSPVMLQAQTTNDSTRIIRMDTGYIRNYYASDIPAYYYKTVNPAVVYNATSKLRRYFLPESWFSIMGNAQPVQFLFHLRQAFAVAWLLSLVYFIFRLFRKR